jgi:hypothetical protein
MIPDPVWSLEVPLGILGPNSGTIVIDVVEPDHEPISWPFTAVARWTFKDDAPWIVIRVGA